MNNPSTEELARQVGDAFTTAFPDSTPNQVHAQAQPESQPADSSTPACIKIGCAYCGCYISDLLTTKLRNGFACPTCTTNVVIVAIKRIQQRLADRGGAFASKEQGNGHNQIKQDWRFAKISLTNRIVKWEALTDDLRVVPEDLTNIKNALAIWDMNKIALADIPGLRYSQVAEQGEPTAEEHETAKLMIELLRLILEKEMCADHLTAQHNRRKRKLSDAPCHQKLIQISIRDEDTNRNEVDEESAAVASSHLQRPPAPKSILKRKASHGLPDTPARKRTRIADIVTVSPPRLNISNPSPFIHLSNTVTTQNHAIHTYAEQQRRKTSFRRSAPSYSQGVWASGPFEEKARTSNFKTSWDRIEKHVAKELKEAEHEQAIFRGIKAVTGTWMGVWWVWKVTRHLDLEQLQEELDRK
ncbi:hypothetical protein IQ06DRAFT_358040 [Phaeosphaeriaceae sp. SRC1lsM3a]|nr:hypothetical protein IQ06DRAFT_358040 [Stagonospora sp. SRC1lsM3a]